MSETYTRDTPCTQTRCNKAFKCHFSSFCLVFLGEGFDCDKRAFSAKTQAQLQVTGLKHAAWGPLVAHVTPTCGP